MVQLRHAGAFLLTRTSVRPLPVNRQCPLDQEAAAMQNFAQFRTLSDNSEHSQTDEPLIVRNGTGDTDLFRSVKLEGLDPARGTVLMFQVSGTAGSRLQIVRKPSEHGEHEKQLADVHLDNTFKQPRSWHEIVPGSLLSADENIFVARVAATPAGGTVAVSDVVLLYHGMTTP
jgi:hypothetical protein